MSSRVELEQRLVVGAAQLLEGPPDVRCEFAHKDLAWVALASQVDPLGVDLVRDIDEEHVEEVVTDVVRLKD